MKTKPSSSKACTVCFSIRKAYKMCLRFTAVALAAAAMTAEVVSCSITMAHCLTKMPGYASLVHLKLWKTAPSRICISMFRNSKFWRPEEKNLSPNDVLHAAYLCSLTFRNRQFIGTPFFSHPDCFVPIRHITDLPFSYGFQQSFLIVKTR